MFHLTGLTFKKKHDSVFAALKTIFEIHNKSKFKITSITDLLELKNYFFYEQEEYRFFFEKGYVLRNTENVVSKLTIVKGR